MSFWRFFESSNAELLRVNAELAWFRSQFLSIAKDLKDERRRNLKREDALMNQVIRLGGGQKLPLRFEEDEKPVVEQEEQKPQGLTANAEMLLRDRHQQYCEQREITSQEEMDKAWEMMKEDPEYWLRD